MMYLPHQRHSSIMRDRESLNQKEPWPFSFALRPFCSAKPAVVGRYLHCLTVLYDAGQVSSPVIAIHLFDSFPVLRDQLVQCIVTVGCPCGSLLFQDPVTKGIITIPGLHLSVLLDLGQPSQRIISVCISSALFRKLSSLFCDPGLVYFS